MKVVTMKFGGPKGSRGHKISFFWGLGFPVISRRSASSLIWVVLNERLAGVRGNVCREA